MCIETVSGIGSGSGGSGRRVLGRTSTHALRRRRRRNFVAGRASASGAQTSQLARQCFRMYAALCSHCPSRAYAEQARVLSAHVSTASERAHLVQETGWVKRRRGEAAVEEAL